MYDVVFMKDWRDRLGARWGYTEARGLATLEDAKKARKCSGDLVVYSGTMKIVPDEAWLLDWELKSQNSYARDGIENERRLIERGYE